MIRWYIEEQKTHANPDLQVKVLADPEIEKILRDAMLCATRV
jgi:hypothetical protein